MAPSSVGKGALEDKSLIEVLTKWLGLFQALIQALAQHSWAKQLLLSGFPDLLKAQGEWTTLMSVNSKPSPVDSCLYLSDEPIGVREIEEAITEQYMEEASPGNKRNRKAKSDTPVVDSATRRSDKVRAGCNGFKINTCKAKNCLGALLTL